MGRLMRGPDDHPPADPAPTPSLVNESDPNAPPADPNAPPADPNAPPADPNAPPKPAEPPAPEPKAEPLTMEALTVPEGFELQPELAGEFLNGEQAPQDRANALLALHGKVLEAASEASSKEFEDTQTAWKDEVKADPEIGGAKLQPVLANIGKLVGEFGTPELKNVFDLTGAGNNIHMVKFLDKIAGVLTEGNYFKAGTPGGGNDPDAAAKRLYPSMPK